MKCVEDMRKEVMKRRIKTEIAQTRSKPINPYNTMKNEQGGEFEQTLVKLADMAKGRVRIDEFTVKDRNTMLDLFVNNEKVLLKIHESLFPKPMINFKTKQALKSPSDKITLDTSDQVNTHLTLDTSLLEYVSKPDILVSNSTIH